MLYSLTASLVLMIMGVVPARMHDASLDVVRKALAVLEFISLCTLIYFSLLYCLIASIQTGAPCSRRFNIAPLYIIFGASSLSPHDILNNLDKLCVSLIQFSAA
jgi:hypothetical protein